MKKLKFQKLILNKETVSLLTDEQSAAIKGGEGAKTVIQLECGDKYTKGVECVC